MTDPSESELKELEAELASLRPAPPRRPLRLEPVPAARPFRQTLFLFWPILATAAAIITVFALRRSRQSVAGTPASAAAPAASVFTPVSAQNVITAVHDDGDVLLGDGTRAHRLNTSLVETVVWKNPKTHATLTWSIPRQEIRIVPIRYQ